MTASHVSGPIHVYGTPLSNTATNTNPDVGPSVTYGGDALFDVRYPYGPGQNQTLLANGLRSPPAVRGMTNYPYVCLVDAIPSTAATVATIGTGVTAGTLTTNNSTWGLSGSMLLVPSGSAFSTANQVAVLGLDLGFGSCTTASTTAVTSYVASDGTGTASLMVGQPIFISGGLTSTAPLFTYITKITSSTAFTIANAAGVSASNLTVGSAHASLTSPDPWQAIGASYIVDPRQSITRGLDYVSDGADTRTVTVAGYDLYGVAMTETATLNGATHVVGLKAFKYIKSVTASATSGSRTITVSSGGAGAASNKDVFGINMRSIQWEYMNIFYNGAFVTTSTGWTVADTTSPATATTGDVRGTYSVQTSAANGSAPSTGRRLAIFQSVRQIDLAQANITTPAPLFGVTQV